MNSEKLNKLIENRIEEIEKLRPMKSDEYSTDKDRLSNFKRAGKMLQCSPEKALIGMWTKHVISILDIVDEIDRNPLLKKYIDMEMVEGKINDLIIYLMLLEAVIKEKYYV